MNFRLKVNGVGLPLGLAWLVASGAGRGDAAELAAVWKCVADSQFAEGQAALRQVHEGDPRERVLVEVVLAWSRPSAAAGQVRELDGRLAGLTDGADDLAAQALYLRARLYQVYAVPVELARARQYYQELARRFPGNHWAQLGLVKLALLTLYALPEPADPAARLAAATALLGEISEPPLRRDLQLQIGWAGLFYDRPCDEVLPHLLAADRIGGMPGIVPEDLVLQIGELSLRAGRVEQARSYFERFLREYPVSTRRFNVRQRLAELDGPAGKAGGS